MLIVGRILFGFLFLGATCLFAADPPPAKEAAKENDKEKEKEKGPPPEKIVTIGQVVGTIQNWNESDGKLKLKVKLRYIEANQQAQQNYARDLQGLLTRQQNLMRMTNPVQPPAGNHQADDGCSEFPADPAHLLRFEGKGSRPRCGIGRDAKVRSPCPRRYSTTRAM